MKNLLYVEDDPNISEDVLLALRDKFPHLNVVHCTNQVSAGRYLAGFEGDVEFVAVLTDWNYPVRAGFPQEGAGELTCTRAIEHLKGQAARVAVLSGSIKPSWMRTDPGLRDVHWFGKQDSLRDTVIPWLQVILKVEG